MAKQHAVDVSGIAGQLKFTDKPITLIRAGGLHTAGCEVFDKAFEAEINRLLGKVNVSVLEIAPVFGAVIHSAHRYFDELPPQFLSNLLANAEKVEL